MSEHIHTPGDPRIFVFGSNLLGIHGAGAAKYAYEKLGAKWGQPAGLQGGSYALPTCSEPGVPLSLKEIGRHVEAFLNFARIAEKLDKNVRFFVSAIATGYAGYTNAEIWPLFKHAPLNCDLPPGWREV